VTEARVPRGQDYLGCRATGFSRTGRGTGIGGDGTDLSAKDPWRQECAARIGAAVVAVSV
jgi:hypothetical protein